MKNEKQENESDLLKTWKWPAMHKLQVTIEIVKLKVPLHKPMEGQEVSLLHSSVTTKLSRTNYWCGLVSRGQKLDSYVINPISQNRPPGCQSP